MLDEVAREVEDRQPGYVVQLGREGREVVLVGAEDLEGGARADLLGQHVEVVLVDVESVLRWVF